MESKSKRIEDVLANEAGQNGVSRDQTAAVAKDAASSNVKTMAVLTSGILGYNILESCSPKHFKCVEYFSTDGKAMPNGIGYQRGYFITECRKNKEAFIVDEAVRNNQYVSAGYKGGVIVFSADANTLGLNANELMNWLKQHIGMFAQRYNASGFLHKVVSNDSEDYIGAYSVGNAFRGKYVGGNGEEYNERSMTIGVGGLSRKGLLYLAEVMARVFKQEAVLVKDFDTDKIYLANGLRQDESPGFSNIITNLKRGYYAWFPVKRHCEGGGNSFIVYNIPRQTAIDLGLRYGQDAVVFIDGCHCEYMERKSKGKFATKQECEVDQRLDMSDTAEYYMQVCRAFDLQVPFFDGSDENKEAMKEHFRYVNEVVNKRVPDQDEARRRVETTLVAASGYNRYCSRGQLYGSSFAWD